MLLSLFFFLNLSIFIFFVKYLGLASSRHCSIPGLYYLFALLPTFGLIFQPTGEMIANRPGVYDYGLAIVFHTLLFGVGLCVAYVFGKKAHTPRRVFVVDHSGIERQQKLVLISVLTLSIILFVHQILALGTVPFFLMFLGAEVEELTVARESGYKLQGGISVYFWHFSRMVFVPYLVSLFFAKYLVSKRRIDLIFFVCVLLFGILNNALSGAKAPVAMLFLCIFLVWVFIKGRPTFISLVFGGLLIFLFPLAVEYSFSDEGLLEVVVYFFEKVANRFSFETFDRTLSYFDIFPYERDFLGGRTNSLFTMISGEAFFNVQNYVFLERLDEFQPHLLHGSANAHFIGYMNADFGIVGVCISSLLVGLAVGVFDIYFSRRVADVSTLAIYVVLCFIFLKFIGSQPTTVLFSHGALLSLIIMFFLSPKILLFRKDYI